MLSRNQIEYKGKIFYCSIGFFSLDVIEDHKIVIKVYSDQANNDEIRVVGLLLSKQIEKIISDISQKLQTLE